MGVGVELAFPSKMQIIRAKKLINQANNIGENSLQPNSTQQPQRLNEPGPGYRNFKIY